MYYQSFYGNQGSRQSNVLASTLENEYSSLSMRVNGAHTLKQLMLPDDPIVEISFGRKLCDVEQVVIEIESLTPGKPVKIHVRELELY